MSDAVRVTHYKVVWEARREGGTIVLQDDGGVQHEITVNNPAALAALILTLRSEPNLTFEPSGATLVTGGRSAGFERTRCASENPDGSS
jgi:hypothetical protein